MSVSSENFVITEIRYSMYYLIKCVLVGSQGVGKTTLVYRYINHKFKDNMHSTIGVDFFEKRLCLDGEEYRLQLWDTAGQERYRSISKTYYRHSNCAIYCFSLTNKDTLNDLKKYIDDFRLYCGDVDVLEVLVGTYFDQQEFITVDKGEVKQLMDNYGIDIYYDISSVDGTNVNEIFDTIINNVKKIVHVTHNQPKINTGIHKEKDDKCCNF